MVFYMYVFITATKIIALSYKNMYAFKPVAAYFLCEYIR